MDFSMGSIFLGLIFGSIGTAYIIYGKRASEMAFLFMGLVISIVPFFFEDTLTIGFVGTLLTIAPFIIRRYL